MATLDKSKFLTKGENATESELEFVDTISNLTSDGYVFDAWPKKDGAQGKFPGFIGVMKTPEGESEIVPLSHRTQDALLEGKTDLQLSLQDGPNGYIITGGGSIRLS